MNTQKFKISQIVDADGQGWIALIKDFEIVGRFTNWNDAKKAYKQATQTK
jgi:hypothetical protein